jgi:sec-independent protein translocase protein TatA
MNLFGNIGLWELILIFAIALIFFGPKRLPEISKGLGKMIRDIRQASQDFTEMLTQEMEEETPSKSAGEE